MWKRQCENCTGGSLHYQTTTEAHRFQSWCQPVMSACYEEEEEEDFA